MLTKEPLLKWAALGRLAAGAAGAAQKVGGSKAVQTAAGAHAIKTAPGMIADKFGWGTEEEDAMRERTMAEHEEVKARNRGRVSPNANPGGIHNAPTAVPIPSTSSVMGMGKAEPIDTAFQTLKAGFPARYAGKCPKCEQWYPEGSPIIPSEEGWICGDQPCGYEEATGRRF